MLSIQAVHLTIDHGRDELVRLAELAVKGSMTTDEV